MAGERLELSDVGRYSSESNLTNGNKFTRGGCYVSRPLGIFLVVLAIAIAIGVAVVGYFVAARDPACKFGKNAETYDGPVSSELKQQCVSLAEKGEGNICSVCSNNRDDASTSSPIPKKVPAKDVRLPTSLEPVYYDLELQPLMYSGDPREFTFRGYVRIVIKCLLAANNVTLHINQLNITDSSLTFSAESPTSSDPVYTSWEEDKTRQFLIIHLDRDLTPGVRYILQVNFTGPLKDDLHGLYLSSYRRGNTTVYLATTQFQPTDARKTFPCFDELAIKSHFNVTLIRPEHLNSLSNTPTKDSSRKWSEDGISWVADVYETTPKMSTYLLAFVVSDFVSLNTTTANNIMYRVWTRPEYIHQAAYALEVGRQILTFFEEYFEIPYPLPKQDMIAIPDFAAGAMENWGLITYRETSMLYQPGVSSLLDKQWVAVVVSHELVHQWFGDLVTPSWWDDLWLNEGFASYMEYVGVDFVHPEWNMYDQFVIWDLHDVFSFDGLLSSHPVYVPVFHPNEINEIFDKVSYGKGASIIRMMKHFLGEKTFKKGLTNYLKGRSYDAAFHDDLWASMTLQAQIDGKTLDIKFIMDTWTLQMNYPVVTFTREGPDNVKVTQTRYLQDPAANDPGKYASPFGYTWDIPITFTSSRERNFNKTDTDVHWLWRTSDMRVIRAPEQLPPLNDPTGWIIGNVLQYGYYRVNYDIGNWNALCSQLQNNYKLIPAINRAQIINDAWSLARGCYLPLEIALKTVEYLHEEMDYVPWNVAKQELMYVDIMLSRTALFGDFQFPMLPLVNDLPLLPTYGSKKAWQVKFMLSKVRGPFSALGLNNTGATHLEAFTRAALASEACYYGNEDCVGNATALFREWMTKPQTNRIDPSLKATVYCTAIREGGLAEWDFAYDQYNTATVAAEKTRLLRALSCSTHVWILSRFLKLSLVSSEIRKQDALRIIQSVSENEIGRSLAWDFFRANWPTLYKEYGGGFFSFSAVITSVTSSFNTEFELQQLRDFMDMYPDRGSGARAFDQAVEKTQSNVAWMKKHYDTLKTWLATQKLAV